MSSLLFICGYYLLTLIFFMLIQRPLFIFLTRRCNPAGKISSGDLARIFSYGFRSDTVGAVYICLLPTLTAIATSFIPSGVSGAVFTGVNIFTALTAGLAAASDPLLYRFWKSKIDASALNYLKTIHGVTASISPWFIVGSLLLWAALSLLFFAGASLVTDLTVMAHPFSVSGVWPTVGAAVVALVVLALMFLILRGTGHRPKTPSVSYFCTNMYLNHCAVNADYNFFYSLKSSADPAKRYRYISQHECDEKAASFYPSEGTPQQQLLLTDRPNILLIIWESLSWRHAGHSTTYPETLPCFNKLMDQGVVFTGVDAGSIRTDRGLVCLLSGYPSPPAEAIIKYTRKLPLLPALPRSLKREGYNTEVWHGGDLTFYHIKDYYLAAGFDSVTDISAFDGKKCRCKWGIHDEIVFNRVADRIESFTAADCPWFITLQTLSSHEPFDVPYSGLPSDPIANAFAYTDRCLERFIERIRKSDEWSDMLIVISGDHGFYHGDAIDRDKYPRIPILLTGGAIARPMVIPTVMSQTDLAATLLGQLGIDHSDYPMSRDVLADSYRDQFSFHSHQTGFMVRDSRGFTEFDIAAARSVEGEDPARELRGQVTLQHLHDQLSRL